MRGLFELKGKVLLRSVRPYGEDPVDMLLVDGRIVQCAPQIAVDASRIVDAGGLVALPGLVDLHTHLRDPGQPENENITTSTRAAAAGGYTCVFAMANTSPVADTRGVVEYVAEIASREASCDVRQVGAMTVGLEGERLINFQELASSSAVVRMFSDDGRCLEDANLMRDAIREAAHVGGFVAQHAQSNIAADGQVNEGKVADLLELRGWPATAEASVVARDAVLSAEARSIGGHVHVCHVSTRLALEVVRWAKTNGWPISAEVTPHHLALTENAVEEDENPVFKVNPPLRSEIDADALQKGLLDGTIDVVATDHAPHSPPTKEKPWAQASFGMIGLETALAVVADIFVHSGRMTWRDVAQIMYENPSRIAGLDHYDLISDSVGRHANMTLVDPNADWKVDLSDLHSESVNSPFEGSVFRTRPVATLWDGQVTYDLLSLFGT